MIHRVPYRVHPSSSAAHRDPAIARTCRIPMIDVFPVPAGPVSKTDEPVRSTLRATNCVAFERGVGIRSVERPAGVITPPTEGRSRSTAAHVAVAAQSTHRPRPGTYTEPRRPPGVSGGGMIARRSSRSGVGESAAFHDQPVGARKAHQEHTRQRTTLNSIERVHLFLQQPQY